MQRESVHDLIKDIFGPNSFAKDVGGWISIHCPLATWTHEKGADQSPSAGISVNEGVSVFNCLAGHTEVITRAGIKHIQELAGSYHDLLMPDGTWQNCKVSHFGQQQLHAVRLSRNGREESIWATENHRWFAQGQGGGKYKELTTLRLKPGMRLQSALPARRTDWTLDRMGVLHGVMFGDGTAHMNDRHGRVNLYGEKMQLAGYLSGIGNVTHYPAVYDQPAYTTISGEFAHMKHKPGNRRDEYLLGFLAGWIATDGCVDERGNVSISSARREHLDWLYDFCLRMDIACMGISKQLRQGYGPGPSAIWTLRFVHSSLDADLLVRQDQRERYAARSVAYERLQWQVTEVEYSEDMDDVYCAEVPGYHAFTLKGFIVTGNCFTCHKKMPLHGMLSQYAGYTGEDLSDIIDEVEDAGYLGARTLPDWDGMKRDNEIELLMPLNEGIYMDLYDSAAGHPYLTERGISDATARKLELLIDPEDPADLKQFGRTTPRILFPVRGPDGILYGFSGRDTTGQSKLKVRDYHGLKKALCLLGSHLITTENPDKVLIGEGLFDYANAWEQGYPFCSVMHSTMTEAQANIVRDFSKPTYLFYDDDKAGQDGVEVAGVHLQDYVPVLRVRYPEIWIEDPREPEGGHWLKDPGEMLAEDFEGMIKDARLF